MEKVSFQFAQLKSNSSGHLTKNKKLFGAKKVGSQLEAKNSRFSSAKHDDISGCVYSTGWKERMEMAYGKLLGEKKSMLWSVDKCL